LGVTSLWRVVIVVAAAAATAACTLPWQQLALPSPPPPGSGPPPKPQHGGAPLAKITGAGEGDKVAPGTGEFTGAPEPRPLRGAVSSRDGVTINLVDASVAEAAKSILGDVLGLNYVVSEKVKGAITIQTAKAIPRDALLETFETVLRNEGAAIVADQGGVYRIVPIAEAVASAPLRTKRAGPRLPGVSTQVIPLRYVSAAEMERIIKAVAPNATLLRTDEARNLLLVAGTRAEHDAIQDAVSIFDVDWMKGMSFGLYPVESGDPDAIAQELDTVFANDRDSPSKGIVRFVPNRRLKSVLVITSRPEFLRKAETWLSRFDIATRATVKQVFVYPIRNRPAIELAQLLQKVYGSQDQGKVAAALRQPAPSATGPGTLPDALVPPPPGPLSATAVPAPSVLPPTAAPPPPETAALPVPAGPSVPPGGPPDDRASGVAIVADEANNALVITATAQEYRRLRQILDQIDVSPNQVLLEATIAEVRLNDDLKMGVRWFLQTGNHQFRFTDAQVSTVAPNFPGFSHFFNTPNVQIVLNALSTITDINIISSPTLMVLDNKKAVLQVGNEVPIATQSAVAVLTPGSPIVNSITYRNTGIVLSITPRIGDRGRIMLDVEQEASDVVRTESSNIDSPTIQQRRIRTTVAVNDGEAIVLGGLIQDRADNKRDQVPLIGQVPVLGTLFKSKTDQIARTELLVAITPRIVKDATQMRGITEEFRAKINLTTRPQRQGPPDRREQIDRLIR
jgi:general secretion pathway protein D